MNSEPPELEECDCCEHGTPAAAPGSEEAPASAHCLEALYDELDWVTLSHLPVPSESRRKIARQVEAVRRVPFQTALASLEEEPQQVEQELKEWLGDQGPKLDRVGLIEVFAGAARLSKQCEHRRGLSSISIGLKFGQDLSRARDRRLLLLLLGRCRSKDVWFSWPSACWSGWARSRLAKGGKLAEEVTQQRQREKPFLRLFEQAWSLQTLLGGHIHAENPVTSLAWKELSLGPAFEVDLHMCSVGLRCTQSLLPIKRPTRIVTSDPLLVKSLQKCRCPGHSDHAHLGSTDQASHAGVYPRQFCRIVSACLARRDHAVTPEHDIFLETDEEADSERESEGEEAMPEEEPRRARAKSYKAMVQKLHVNTGHASIPQMLRLAQRARAPAGVIEEIRKFRCPICEELQVPPSHRVAALKHTETPNHIVGIDVVQVELKRDGVQGVEQQKFQVLTVVDYASDFAQQAVLPPGPRSVSGAFHSLWCRPFGPPRVVYVDPDQRWMSEDFQKYLRCNSITLLDSATESHWQLGRVEVAQKILRMMAQRVWRTSDRPASEVIESCSSVRNEQLKRHGFSSAQWFLGREPRVPGSLSDITEQQNPAVQDAVHAETDFAQKMQVRQQAAEAFLQAHAHTTWSRAIKSRNRPIRGPYVVGQSVYVFRKQGKGQFSTRHGSWLGPGRVVGTESFREGSPVPRVVWVVVNGFMYKCSPECLRPLVEDEVAFKQIAQEFHAGNLPDELEQVTPSRRGPAGRCFDLTQDVPLDEDFLTPPASDQEGGDAPPERSVRRRITRDDDYWRDRAEAVPPRGEPMVRFREDPSEGEAEPSSKTARVEPIPDELEDYSPSLPPPEPPEGTLDPAEMPPVPDSPWASDTEMLPASDNLCCEITLDVFETDVTDDAGCLWQVLDECAVTAARPGQKRRVEVNFRKLGDADKERFKGAIMKKEWQSWLENRLTTIVKSKGIAKSRIIGSRWVLTWKKSSDPDDKTLTPKARLVLVGFQDPDLGRIATDSPTLRKESKHIILSICASKGWTIWGADIKTAFLSGDNSSRDLYFRPPPEVKEFLNLSEDDVLRLEKAAYGLAEAPRAWFLRLTRELVAVGLEISQLDPCVFLLRCKTSRDLLGLCGVHVDDLLGGGTQCMDECLKRLRATLPFGDFRKGTIKYTGAEIRQLSDNSIEVSQENVHFQDGRGVHQAIRQIVKSPSRADTDACVLWPACMGCESQ